MLSYMIVYPRGNRSRLCVAQVWDYEKSDYDLASRREFRDESEAKEYMIELAERNGLSCDGIGAYLD